MKSLTSNSLTFFCISITSACNSAWGFWLCSPTLWLLGKPYGFLLRKKKSSSSSTAVCSRFSQTWMDSLHTSVCLTLPACLQELFFDAASPIPVQEISLRFTNIFHRVSEWLGWNLWEFRAPCSSRDMDLLAQDCVQMAFLIISKDGDSKTSGLSKPPAFTVKKNIFWCSWGASCSLVCALYLCLWEPPKRAWLHLLCTLPAGPYLHE